MLKTFALQKYKEKMDSSNHSAIPWVFLDFCPLGFIGKLFVSSELSDFIQYLSVFYNDWPCDWLLAAYTRTRACPFPMKVDRCYLGWIYENFFALIKLKSEAKKKRDTFKNWPLIKNPQFLSYPHETWWKWSPHEKVSRFFCFRLYFQ